MKQHIKIVAVLYIALGGLGIIAMLIVFGMLGGMPDFSTVRRPPSGDDRSCVAALRCLLL